MSSGNDKKDKADHGRYFYQDGPARKSPPAAPSQLAAPAGMPTQPRSSAAARDQSWRSWYAGTHPHEYHGIPRPRTTECSRSVSGKSDWTEYRSPSINAASSAQVPRKVAAAHVPYGQPPPQREASTAMMSQGLGASSRWVEHPAPPLNRSFAVSATAKPSQNTMGPGDFSNQDLPVTVSNEDPATPPASAPNDIGAPVAAAAAASPMYAGKRHSQLMEDEGGIPFLGGSAVKKARNLDKLDMLVSASLELGPLMDNSQGCSCPKSKCIALYCDCFKAGRRCHPDICSCLNCKNTIDESGPRGARTLAIRSILSRNPRAFVTAGLALSSSSSQHHKSLLPPGEVACNCVRSRCLKLYCSCFAKGQVCRSDLCSCVKCANVEDDPTGDRAAAIEQLLEKKPRAFESKPKRVPGAGCACKNNRCVRKYCECFRNELLCSSKCVCIMCENAGAAGEGRQKGEPLYPRHHPRSDSGDDDSAWSSDRPKMSKRQMGV